VNADDFLPQAPGHLVVIPEGVKGFVPDPLPPPGFSIAPCCLLAEQAAMALGGLKNLVETLPNAELLIGTFLRREALRSSKIEGTHTKLGQLLLFELGELPDADGQQEDAEQVNRNFQAFQFGIKRVSELPVCGRLFREIHISRDSCGSI
jgi:Fic family protein